MISLPTMLRFLLGRLGMFAAIAVTTLLTMAVSVAMTVVLMLAFHLPRLDVGIALSAFCPFAVMPFLTRFYLSMIDRLEATNLELQAALAEVKELRGMLPICASCKRIHEGEGYWTQIESYIAAHSHAEFTHGICPDCNERLYGRFLRDAALTEG